MKTTIEKRGDFLVVEVWIPVREMKRRKIDVSRARIAHLTAQQSRVARFAASGLCNKEIAARLNIGVQAVKFHVSNILQRLDISSRHEIASRI